jgi:lipopolysaccharide heptosyltransferase II
MGKMKNTYIDTKDIARILIIKPSSLGDVIHTLPLLKALRDQFPRAYIAWLVSPTWADILEGNPYLDQIFFFPKEKWAKLSHMPLTLKEIFPLIRQIREKRFQLVIDVQGLLRSSLVSFFSRAPYRLGFANAREGSPLFYNKKVPVPDTEIHAVDRYLTLLSLFTDTTELPQPEFFLDIPETTKDNICQLLSYNQVDLDQPIFLINPGGKWITKRWPPAHYARLAQHLKEQFGGNVVIIGGKEDIGLAEEISSLAQTRLTLLAGKTSLKELAALLKLSTLLITNDSGPMHLANAVGTPIVAIFGPTNPKRTGPYRGNYRIVRQELPCIPCYLKRCPTEHECLQALGVDEVMAAIRQIWERVK